MTILNKDQIFQASDLKTEEFEVPEWGGKILLRQMTGSARDTFEEHLISNAKNNGKSVDMKGMKVLLISLAVVDDKDELMFTKEDLEELNKKSAKPINDLFEKIQQMNGIGDKQIKEAQGN